jgi:O-antigen ligase
MSTQQNSWQSKAIFILIILMMVSLFVSRAFLSISMGIFFLLCFLHGNLREHFRKFFTTPLLWGMTLLFFIPLLSGLWSDDLTTWSRVVRVKLPLLLFPLAFAGPWKLSKDHWRIIAGVFLLLVVGGTLWSIVQYIVDREAIHAAYLKAKTIPVPLEGDYIRFSWLVCVGLIISVLLFSESPGKRIRAILILLCCWFIVYLHILAARTGLFACYIFLFLFVLYQLFNLKRRGLAFILLAGAIIFPVLAWIFFPTFQNRVKYLRYDFDYVINNSYLQGATDGNRLFSIKAGWNIVKDNLLGVGAGDLKMETKKWYEQNVPGMVEMDKIYPSNEWLIYGGFAGWIAIAIFTLSMVIPFYTSIKHKFYWNCFHITAIFSFLVDTGLEVQYGVFLYGFITCCWWKSLREN